MTPTVYFLHGQDSSPRSAKIQHLTVIARAHGWKVVAPDLSWTKDPELRITHFLENVEKSQSRKIIVGSSMGGYVALVVSRILQPEALLLLAPALNLDGYREADPEPVAGEVTIVHGWNDHLIDPASVFHFAGRYRTTLHMVNDGHTLQQSIPFIGEVFKSILERCKSTPRQKKLTAVI